MVVTTWLLDSAPPVLPSPFQGEKAKNKDVGLVPGKKAFPKVTLSAYISLVRSPRESRKKTVTSGYIVHFLPLLKQDLLVRKKRNVAMREITNIYQISLVSIVS